MSHPSPSSAVAEQEVYQRNADVFDAVWRFFCSTRLALILILVIAATSLSGTLLVQAPAGITAEPTEYARWLVGIRSKYGGWSDIFSALQLFDVFNSIWFRLLLAGLTMSTVICTINRWNGIWRSVSKPRVRMGEAFFHRASHSVVLPSGGANVGELADSIRDALGRQRYRVLVERDETRAFLYADKNRFGRLGTFLSHLSLVLILGGAIAGGMFGFHNREFVVPVGSERPVGFNTGLTMRVDQFIDEYYPEGPPKDFRSDAVLLENGKEVARHTIRVNDPLEYKGIRFYQAFFGPGSVVQVKDGSGNVLYQDGVALAWRSKDDRPVGSFSLPGNGLEVYVVAPVAGRADALVPAGQMRLEVYRGSQLPQVDNLVMGVPKKVGDLEFTFQREVQFTGLQVAKDPGAPIIWLASTLLIVGLAMVFYFPHRRIWLICRPRSEEGTEVLVGAAARRDMGFDEEFRRVLAAVEAVTRSGRRTGVLSPG